MEILYKLYSFFLIFKITANKPSWSQGASINFVPKTVQSTPLKWSLANDDLDDYVDQDSLLDNDLVAPKKLVNSDCGTSVNGMKKACKDCSCGAADPTNTSVVTSACGSV